MPLSAPATLSFTAWSSSAATGEERWASLVERFNIRDADGMPAQYMAKSLYFLPDCSAHNPVGRTGGGQFGVLAEIPVLVD